METDEGDGFHHRAPRSAPRLKPCPRCGSRQVHPTHVAQQALGALGAIAGAASAASRSWAGAEVGAGLGTIAGGPPGALLGGLAGAALGALTGGLVGCELGVRLGMVIDDRLMPWVQCQACGRLFLRAS